MKFIKWCDDHKWIYITLIVFLFAIPILVEFIPIMGGNNNTRGDWLGFWGSYLGIIPAGLITYFMYLKEREIDRKKNMSLLLVKDTDLFISQCIDLRNAIEAFKKDVYVSTTNALGFYNMQSKAMDDLITFDEEISLISEQEIPVFGDELRKEIISEINATISKSFVIIGESQNTIELKKNVDEINKELYKTIRKINIHLSKTRAEQLKAKKMVVD